MYNDYVSETGRGGGGGKMDGETEPTKPQRHRQSWTLRARQPSNLHAGVEREGARVVVGNPQCTWLQETHSALSAHRPGLLN